MLTRAGARVASIHPFTAAYESLMFFSDYERRTRDSVEQYRRYFAAAAFLGARTVVFHGARKDLPIPMELYCERYARLAAAAREEGAVLAQENVSRCKCGASENIAAMRALLGEQVHFVLDVKQALRAGEAWGEMCGVMQGRIAAVHLSDHAPGRDCLLPGAGQADFSLLRANLRAQAFDGPLFIEVYRSNFNSLAELPSAQRYAADVFSPE